mmetsp:Transcript_25505/g.35544  ORF Transcript_25505/g.35544 Transcript_25505/m.35544 type:complete len:268 (-) Transcript_25505:186-989(-)|eukprot:CAMPEP_0184481826 /NCGR_PEP_ID=MMETSP0113_2-20130426/3413_1 /TAXON_ID=91329 /ORGANISM="Norrisiella sphaerica, Strain BC52" /LENGTH=267 /DNA_ID=CAMNT_0026861219 /DNA_START=197 /DNA_END=1000 /DNA_ORIENTATION=-
MERDNTNTEIFSLGARSFKGNKGWLLPGAIAILLLLSGFVLEVVPGVHSLLPIQTHVSQLKEGIGSGGGLGGSTGFDENGGNDAVSSAWNERSMLDSVRQPGFADRVKELFRNPDMMKKILTNEEIVKKGFDLLRDPAYLARMSAMMKDPSFTSQMEGIMKDPLVAKNMAQAREIIQTSPQIQKQVKMLESWLRELTLKDPKYKQMIMDIKNNGGGALERAKQDIGTLRDIWNKASPAITQPGTQTREMPNSDDLDKLSAMFSTMKI